MITLWFWKALLIPNGFNQDLFKEVETINFNESKRKRIKTATGDYLPNKRGRKNRDASQVSNRESNCKRNPISKTT